MFSPPLNRFCLAAHVAHGCGPRARETADCRPSEVRKRPNECIAMCKPSTSSSVATRIFSRFRTTKLEELFLGAAARVAGYSDKSFSWARKIRWLLRSSRNPSSAAWQPRATTSGVILAGRRDRRTGYQRQSLRLPSRRRRISDNTFEARQAVAPIAACAGRSDRTRVPRRSGRLPQR